MSKVMPGVQSRLGESPRVTGHRTCLAARSYGELGTYSIAAFAAILPRGWRGARAFRVVTAMFKLYLEDLMLLLNPALSCNKP